MEDIKIKDFCIKNKIQLMVLFGSSASGKLHLKSDTDIAVKLEQNAEVSKLELIYELSELFMGKEIDLVVLTTDTDPVLLYEIFSSGRLLYEKYSGIFDREKLKAWKRYIDTKKIRILQKRYLKEFLEKVSHVS